MSDFPELPVLNDFDDATSPDSSQRRGFVALMAAIVGFVVAVLPAVFGLFTFLDPVKGREKRFAAKGDKDDAEQTDDDGYIQVASLDDVKDDGLPRRFEVRADVTNKWSFSPNEPIGEVFLIRDKGQEQPTAFTTVCPHLGCSIKEAAGEDGAKLFRCPCHNSSFELDGAMIQPTPSPRDMDQLDVKLSENGQDVLVKYENFYTGKAKKIAKT